MDKSTQPGTSGLSDHPVKGEIGIWLDSYNDIFSDFDPRPYSERALSDDFIAEVRKVCREKGERKRSLKLSLPALVRKPEEEKVINKRLHGYFKNIFKQIEQEEKMTNRRGVYYILTGITLMLIASYVSFRQPAEFHIHALLILFEPAGWFFLWTGLDHLIYFSKKRKGEREFYSKMAKAEIDFVSY